VGLTDKVHHDEVQIIAATAVRRKQSSREGDSIGK